MGQYHTIFNRTKKQFFSIGGAKLLEKSFDAQCSTALMVLLCNSNGRGGGDLYFRGDDEEKLKASNKAIIDAIERVSGLWAGDSIVIQGDYAKESDPAYCADTTDYTDITQLVELALCAEPDFRNSKLLDAIDKAANTPDNVVEFKAKEPKAPKVKKRRTRLQPWQIGSN